MLAQMAIILFALGLSFYLHQKLKNPDLPPCVVYESRYPRMMNSMESTGSSSRTSRVPLVYSAGRRNAEGHASSSVASGPWDTDASSAKPVSS